MNGAGRHGCKVRRWIPLFSAGAALTIVTLAACDSGPDQAVCAVVLDEMRTRTEAIQTSAATPPAQFEFSQHVLRYETVDCRREQDDVDEVSLVIRNLTSCELALSYQLSFIENQDGWSYNGSLTFQPRGAIDVGVISRVGNANIESAQLLLSGNSSTSTCTASGPGAGA